MIDQARSPDQTISIVASDVRESNNSAITNVSPGLATVLAALFTLLGGLGGALLTSFTTLHQTKANVAAQIQQQGQRLAHEMKLHSEKQHHEINLEQQKFVQQTISTVIGKGTEDQQRQALRFYAKIGIIGDPYARKILELPADQLPVAELQQRLVFNPTSDIPREQLGSLQTLYTSYIQYLERVVGFPKPAQHAVLHPYSSPDELPTPARSFAQQIESFYLSEYKTVFMPRRLLNNTPLVLREYTHVALHDALGAIVMQTEVESGLSDYFPASFLASGSARDEKTTRLLQGLAGGDPKTILEGGLSPIVQKGASWTAALWQCREPVGPERADKLILQAWRAAHRIEAQSDPVAGFGAALLEASRAAGMMDAERCYKSELEGRKLPSKRGG